MTTDTQKIINYYNATESDYKLFWHLNKSMAIHYGYWDEKTKNLPQALHRANEVLAERTGIKKSDHVLDAGCGVGGSAIYLAKTIGCKVTGITLVPKQIKIATENAKRNGVETLVTFQNMNYLHTSFKDASFDVVWALETVCHSGEHKKFIEEAFRLLKKNGRLMVSDYFVLKKDYNNELTIKRWVEGWANGPLETKQNFKKYLMEAGFKKISSSDITKNIAPSSKIMYRNSFLSLIFGKIEEFLKIKTKIQNANGLACYYQYKALKKNLWENEVFYAEKK